MSDYSTTSFRALTMADLDISGECRFVVSDAGVPRWVSVTELWKRNEVIQCGYCKSRHHETNCPNCGAPK